MTRQRIDLALRAALGAGSALVLAFALATSQGRVQLAESLVPVTLYLTAWATAAWIGRWRWRAALPVGGSADVSTPTTPLSDGFTTSVRPELVEGPGQVLKPPFSHELARPLAILLLALGAASYWNGAILDPLQFRGFPDYVTQMRGARLLLAGELPYDPTIRVWTDVNLPPITLLLLFAPFTALSELGGKLAYFALNHLAYLAGLALLLVRQRPAHSALPSPLWAALVALMALTFEPWHDSLRLGQQNGVVFLCLTVAAVAAAQRRDALAGVALAAALIGKPSSALLGLYFLFARRWRAAFAAAIAGLGAFLVTLPLTGWESWRFYLLDKAPQILAGTPQQSNVALLAFHARLFLPLESLASVDAMPVLPVAQALTRVSQLLGAYALWRLVTRPGRRTDPTALYLEFSFALVLSLVLVGHAWQSYLTWLVVAFVPLADSRLWDALTPRTRWPIALLAGACYAALTVNDVTLHRVTGSTTPTAAVFAALPTFALLTYAYLLALLCSAHDLSATRPSDATAVA